MDYVIAVVIALALSLVYLNGVASIIFAKDSELSRGVKVARIIFVWLIPIIGFAITLRFSFQENQTDLHAKLVPKWVAKWLYDERKAKPNPLRDDNDLKCQTGFRTFR